MKATFFEELRFGRHLIAFAKDPSDLERIRKLGDIAGNLRDRRAAQAVVAFAMQDVGYRRMNQEGYEVPTPNLGLLAQLPTESFGYAYAKHFRDNELSVDFMNRSSIQDPATQFLSDRVHLTHDIVHVIAGYGTDKVGELAVQAFCLGQLPSGIHAAIIAAGLLNLLREDLALIPDAFDAMSESYERGKRAHFLLGVRWEDHWEEPLDSLRRRLDVSARHLREVAA